jgi:hypothetical protein
MFLHEDSEQMRDKRIQTIQEYKEGANGQVERIRQKRIHNTIQTSHQPNSPGIFNIGNTINIKNILINMQFYCKQHKIKFLS